MCRGTDIGELGVALWEQELGMGEGECCGSGWSVYVHLGMCTCPLRVSTARALWHSPLESEERLLSCRSPLVLQDGPAASPSALALGTGASF